MQLVVHLVRHASINSADRRYPLSSDETSINQIGVEKASLLNLPKDATCICAPSLRCRQTAAAAGFTNFQTTTSLQEVGFGVMAGRTWEELERVYANLPWHWTKALSDPTLDFGPPQGETGRKFHARIQSWLEGLPESGEVVVFAHTAPIHAVLRLTIGFKSIEMSACTTITIKKSSQNWVLSGMRTP